MASTSKSSTGTAITITEAAHAPEENCPVQDSHSQASTSSISEAAEAVKSKKRKIKSKTKRYVHL